MKKICHMTSVHTRYDIRIFQKECRSLAKAGYEVSLIVNDLCEDEVRDGVHIHSVFYKSENRMDRMLHVTRKIYEKALQTDADIYHFHDPELLFYGYALKKRGKKVIFDSHEFLWKQIECRKYIPKLIRKPAGLLYKKCEEYVVRRIDAVIVPCTYNGRRYFGNKCKREVLINNYPDLNELTGSKRQFSERKRQVCYVGGLTKERGVMEMARACMQAEIPLVLAGTFSDQKIRKEITGLSQFVTYKGKLQRADVKALLDESYLGISVLQQEGQYSYLDNLPTKVYEYMAEGIPVLISDFPYYKKIIQRFHCGRCVNAGDVDEIAGNIKWMVNHPREACQMGKNGRKIALKRFNWNMEEKKLLKLYDELFRELQMGE